MVHKHCSHGLCQSDSRKDPSIKFAIFPKPRFGKERVKLWVELCGRKNFKESDVTKDTYICELHFDKDIDLNYKTNQELEPYPVGYIRRERKQQRSPTHGLYYISSKFVHCGINLGSQLLHFLGLKVKVSYQFDMKRPCFAPYFVIL